MKIWELVERSLYNVRDGDSLSVQRLDEDYMLIFCLVNFILDTCRFWYFNVLGLGMRKEGHEDDLLEAKKLGSICHSLATGAVGDLGMNSGADAFKGE